MLKYVSPTIIWVRANAPNDILKINCNPATNPRVNICVFRADRNYHRKLKSPFIRMFPRRDKKIYEKRVWSDLDEIRTNVHGTAAPVRFGLSSSAPSVIVRRLRSMVLTDEKFFKFFNFPVEFHSGNFRSMTSPSRYGNVRVGVQSFADYHGDKGRKGRTFC